MNEYQIAGVIGLCSIAAWVAGYILSWAGAWAWAWVDDKKEKGENLVCKMTVKALNIKPWKPSPGEYWDYYKGPSYSERTASTDLPLTRNVSYLVVMGSIPMATLIAAKLYPITIGAVTFYMIAQLARYARRHKKVFDKHVVDKEAHQ